MRILRSALLLLLLLLLMLPVGLTLGSTRSAHAGARADPGGRWGWPLGARPAVGRRFQPPTTAYAAGHRGVDLLGRDGQPVVAAGAGRVSYAGLLAGRGVVVVDHGALRTTYEPVSASVRVGEQVALGALLGTLVGGHLGCPVAACLHWGLRRGEDYLDPLQLVRHSPGVLLPVPPAADHPVPAADLPIPAPAPPAPRARAVTRPVLPAGPPAGAAAESGWSLVAHRAPLSSVALLALLAGVALLAGRRHPGPPDGPPRRPASAAALAVPGGTDSPRQTRGDDGGSAPVVQLQTERERRRTAC